MKILDAGLEFGYVGKRKTTEYIILHHAAGYGTVEYIHASHKALKWSGIGYNFYVRKDGSVWKGRGLDTVGAHAGGNYNSRSVGICAEGNFQKDFMSDAQKQSLIELLAYVWSEYPQAKVVGHRDMDYTACPGRNYPFGEIVSGAQQLMAAEPKPEPKQEAPPATAPTGGAFIALPTLKRGAYGESVKAMQILLIGRGFSCGRWGADGSFGAATHRALNSFQNGNNLPADGICDIAVWRKLLGV